MKSKVTGTAWQLASWSLMEIPLAMVTARIPEHFVEWVSLVYLWALQTASPFSVKIFPFLINWIMFSVLQLLLLVSPFPCQHAQINFDNYYAKRTVELSCQLHLACTLNNFFMSMNWKRRLIVFFLSLEPFNTIYAVKVFCLWVFSRVPPAAWLQRWDKRTDVVCLLPCFFLLVFWSLPVSGKCEHTTYSETHNNFYQFYWFISPHAPRGLWGWSWANNCLVVSVAESLGNLSMGAHGIAVLADKSVTPNTRTAFLIGALCSTGIRLARCLVCER